MKIVLAVCCLAFLISYTNGNSLSGSTRIYENNILDILEDIRLRMCYTDPFGLPQLEPLILKDQIDFNFGNEINGFVRNVRVEGLSKFIVDYLEFRITLRFDVAVTLPELVISGDYGLNANIAGLFNIKGNGPFRLNFGGIQLDAKAAFAFQNQMYLRDLKLGAKLHSLFSNIVNLSSNPQINELLNSLISISIPELINKMPSEKFESIENFIENWVTKKVGFLTAADLLGIISSSGKQLFPPLDEGKACKIPNCFRIRNN